MIDFEPSEEQRLVRESVADFAQSKLAPRVREVEKARAVPEDVRKLAHEMGIGLVTVPERAGGQGLGVLTADCCSRKGYRRRRRGRCLRSGGPRRLRHRGGRAGDARAGGGEPRGLRRRGRVRALRRRRLERACAEDKARAGFTTIAAPAPGGFTITGEKAFVVNAHLADRFLVFAQIDAAAGWGGIGAFVVRRDNPGLTIAGARSPRHARRLGAADFGEIALRDAFVDASARLLGDVGHDGGPPNPRLHAARPSTSSPSARSSSRRGPSVSRASPSTSRASTARRAPPSASPSGTSRRWPSRSPTATWTSSPRAGSCGRRPPPGTRAVTMDAPSTALHASAQAARLGVEAAMRTADDLRRPPRRRIGFIRDLVAEKLMRDSSSSPSAARPPSSSTNSRAALDLGVPLDPALVLPTPETQAIFT